MAKRCLLILLVLALCLAGIPAAAFADESSPAEETSPEFPFTDVKPGDWHYEYIRSAFLHGIVTGMTATTFVPEGKLTHAQVMVMAANLHSMQKKDNYDFQAGKKAGDPWYQVFKDYCKAEGIIDGRFDGKENEEVTRAEMSYYFAHTMTPDSYQERKAVSLSDIGSDPYKAEIEKLALADIVGGFTDGTFRPDDPVTRAQSAVYVRNTVDTIEELEEAVPEETPAGGSAHKEENVSAPVITTQPQNATVDEGSSAEFTVAASGTRLTYQWEVSADGTAWANAADEGSTTNTLTVTAAASNNGYQYRCVVSNAAGSVTSEAATLSVTSKGVKIDSVNFPDETFREDHVRSFDLDGNGYLSDAEIAAVKGINCTSKGIATLQGVEFFTALKNLNCSGSSLTSLNVSGNSLTSLDVSDCTALENLNCSGNSLWSLNVSGCTVLDTLDCHSNDLQSLDVSTCTALENLNCSGNSLWSLNVSGCTALADAIVAGNRSDRDSYWEYAKDSALLRVGKDVVLTPADRRPYVEINEDHFPDENFRRVVSGFDSDSDGWLSQADLVAATVMDCSSENIANIDGIAFFTALTTLDCSNNQLMELDVSSSKRLTSLNCSGNMLSSLDLNGNPALTTLDCNWNALESLNVSSCSALTTLDCYANRMEELDLSGCTALTELVCRSAHLKSLTISGKTALTTLDCRNNEITTLSVTNCPALTSVLFTGNDLKSLDLSGCTALTGVNFGSSETGGALETADLSGCTALTGVSCTDRNLVSLDLSGCSSLKTVSCFNNKMTSLDVSGCTALTDLDCSINSISTLDVSGSPALCDAITLGAKSGTDIVTYSYNGATLKVNSTVSLTPSDPNQ